MASALPWTPVVWRNISELIKTLLKKQKEKSAILMRRYNTCRYFQCRTHLPPGHKTAPRQLKHKQTVMWIKSIYLAVAVERFVAECCLHTVQFSSVQNGIYTLGKAHMRSTPSLRSFPAVVQISSFPLAIRVECCCSWWGWGGGLGATG